MTKLTVAKIRKLKEPGNYGDGDWLMLRLSASGMGRWVLRAMMLGKRCDISFRSLEFMSLPEAPAGAFQICKDIKYGRDLAAERKKQSL